MSLEAALLGMESVGKDKKKDNKFQIIRLFFLRKRDYFLVCAHKISYVYAQKLLSLGLIARFNSSTCLN